MNKRMTVYIIAKMLGVEGAVLLLPAIVSWIYGEKNGFAFLAVSAVLGLIYLLFGRKVPKVKRIYAKEGLVIVGAAWVLWSLFGARRFLSQEKFRVIWMLFLKQYRDLDKPDSRS